MNALKTIFFSNVWFLFFHFFFCTHFFLLSVLLHWRFLKLFYKHLFLTVLKNVLKNDQGLLLCPEDSDLFVPKILIKDTHGTFEKVWVVRNTFVLKPISYFALRISRVSWLVLHFPFTVLFPVYLNLLWDVKMTTQMQTASV